MKMVWQVTFTPIGFGVSIAVRNALTPAPKRYHSNSRPMDWEDDGYHYQVSNEQWILEGMQWWFTQRNVASDVGGRYSACCRVLWGTNVAKELILFFFMRGSHFLKIKDETVTLWKEDTVILSLPIPATLSTSKFESLFWEMTATSEKIILKYRGTTVFLRDIKTLAEDEKIPLEVDTNQGFWDGIFTALGVLAAVGLCVFLLLILFPFPMTNRVLFHEERVFHGGLLSNTLMYEGDVLCNSERECACIPNFITETSIWPYYLVMQSDGNLVHYNFLGTAIWSSGTKGQDCFKFTYEGNGTFKLHCNGRDSIVYDTKNKNKEQAPGPKGPPGLCIDSFGPGIVGPPGIKGLKKEEKTPLRYQTLLQGQELTFQDDICDTRNKCLTLQQIAQFDAIYRFDFSKDWVLRFQKDSNLVLYDGQGETLWSSGTNGQNCSTVYKLADALVINCEKEVKLIK